MRPRRQLRALASWIPLPLFHDGHCCRRLFWRQWSILGATLGDRREYQTIVELAHQGRLWPIVDSTVPLARAIEAFARLERGEQTGKLVIEVAT